MASPPAESIPAPLDLAHLAPSRIRSDHHVHYVYCTSYCCISTRYCFFKVVGHLHLHYIDAFLIRFEVLYPISNFLYINCRSMEEKYASAMASIAALGDARWSEVTPMRLEVPSKFDQGKAVYLFRYGDGST